MNKQTIALSIQLPFLYETQFRSNLSFYSCIERRRFDFAFPLDGRIRFTKLHRRTKDNYDEVELQREKLDNAVLESRSPYIY